VINFRYHVVSLTAVFFALAIGLVVGTAALNGPAVDSLRAQVNTLGQEKQALRDQVNHLNADVEAREQFAEQAAAELLANKLTGTSVLIVSTPSGGEFVEGAAEMLVLAGATISGRVGLTDSFLDPARNDELLDLAHTAQPASVTGTLPTNSDGVESATALLAAVLVERTPALAEADRRAVLEAFGDRDLITGGEDVTTPAEAVVLLSGPPFTGNESARRNAAVVTVVAQFDRAGSVMVAANGDTGAGNVVAEVRGDPALQQTVSTVDNLPTPQGRVVLAWGLANQLAGTVRHLGLGSGTVLVPTAAQ
jgi:hypothetical protein